MNDDQNKNKRRSTKKNFFRNNVSHSDVESRTRSIRDSQQNSNWSFYFPENISEEDLTLKPKLKLAEEYLLHFNEEQLIDIYNNRFFLIEIQEIKEFNVENSWQDFLKDLENTPNLVIGLFGFIAECIINLQNVPELVKNRENEIVWTSYKKIIPRFIGSNNFLKFQDLKSYNYGRFVTVIGVVVRASDVKPFCTEIAFSCAKCKEIQITIQEKRCYTTPNRCKATGCYSTQFKPLLKSPHTQTVSWKTIRLQELNADQSEGGRVPRSIECELTRDLTNVCIPGDVVTISGIVDINNVNEKKTTAGKDACSYTFYICANSVTCIKGKNVEGKEVNGDSLDFKLEDLSLIKQIHSEPNLFRLVVASLNPNIFGHDLVKAGLILALFGGGSAFKEDSKNTKFAPRENSHILIVGDPGLGKSQMLLASAAISPRSVYVCGNSTTASGLTVTLSKEGGCENSLEAGALVLADQGHCCIDEFDKMMQQHSALLEAMEQQTISMAKSGVVCTLPARTSIIAAANPSGGHYSKSKTVSENLKINGALLSRFDLVFILQDRADDKFDDKMSKHIMAIHAKDPNSSMNSSYFEKNSSLNDSLANCQRLKQRLRVRSKEKLNYIPHSTLQKYISYARKFSHPKLTPEVCDILKQFYLEMRRQHNSNYSTPITTRQLESLIRLTKARARIELRCFCTPGDAEDVIEIMKYSMWDTFSDEFGNIDIDRSIHGSGMSKRSQAKKLITVLTKAAACKADDCFTISEIKDLAKCNKVAMDDFDTLIENLNDQGFLLKKGFQLYKIQTI